MSSETVQIIIFVATVVIAGITLWRSQQAITASNVVTTVKASVPIAEQLAKVAEIAVQANEQRKREGKITNEQAYQDALNYVKKWVPAASGIDNEDIIKAINSAILVSSFMADQLPKKDRAEARPTPPVGRMGL